MAVTRAQENDRPPARSVEGRPVARVVRERLSGEADPIQAARWLRDEPRPVVLSGDWVGGGIVLSSHPSAFAAAGDDPFERLERMPLDLERVDRARLAADAGQDGSVVGGGWFGWLGFGLAGAVETLPPAPPRPLQLPRFDLAFHDHVVRCDARGTWWFEALWTEPRALFLSQQLDCWRRRLARPAPIGHGFSGGELRPVAPGLTGHRAAVAETVRRIARGELSQANVCLRLEAAFDGDPLDLWVDAVARSRPAYAAYVGPGGEDQTVVSLSPELFLRRGGGKVVTRPIKGTLPLSEDPAILAASAKDRAENVMIVDLMRNDLGRVCSYGSVRVDELCAVRRAAGVWHLESTVSGALRPGVGDGDLLRATFPPGSVTGAPKVHALRTIHELEATAREAYCGAIGLCSPLAGLELNVAIRTLEVSARRLWLGVGGGVVADSSPPGEVEEALAKARGVAVAAGLSVATDQPVARWEPSARSEPCARWPPIARHPRPDAALGVFETIRVAGGRPRWLHDHCARLEGSCRALGLPVPDHLPSRVREAAAALADGGVRVLVNAAGVEISVRALPPAGATTLRPMVVPGGLGAHKWADRGLIDVYSDGGVAPLICDLDGDVLEAGYAAVLLATDDALIAPPLDGRLLASVSRHHTLEAGRRAGRRVVIRPMTIDQLRAADAIILTSSLRGPHPGMLAGESTILVAPAICAELARQLATD